MLVYKEFLYTKEIVIAVGSIGGIDVNCTNLLRQGAVKIKHGHEAEFIIGRPECRVALDQCQTDNARLT